MALTSKSFSQKTKKKKVKKVEEEKPIIKKDKQMVRKQRENGVYYWALE